MKLRRAMIAVVVLAWSASMAAGDEAAGRRLSVAQYRDQMKAGWIGQILGVSWGAPTEGRYRQIMPEDQMPPFQDTLINGAFGQDDLYVEMTFLRSMEEYGFDVSLRQAGIDFANSGYPLWVANDAGRRNLRNGIAPPDSSHPKFHNCAGAIDYQIEADYSGLIAPGMPSVVISLGERFGRLMNYGDGVYAGQFMGAMYAEAFFEKDVEKIIQAGLKCIPQESLYAQMVRDMLQWHRENPDDWEKTWDLVDKKYRKDPTYSYPVLDAKVEGAFVLMGLLYGGGDPDRTIVISCRCGSDSDCNPSSSGGVLFTSLGVSDLPERFYGKLDEKAVFSHTAYNFPALLDVCEKLARQAVLKAGGRVEKDADGQEVFVIPVQTPMPSRFEDLRNPGPVAGSLYSDEEMRKIHSPGLRWTMDRILRGWKLTGADLGRGSLFWQWQGRNNVLVLFTAEQNDQGWALASSLDLPAGKRARLRFLAGCPSPSDAWELGVRADGKQLVSKTVDPKTVQDGWLAVDVDLSAWAGKTVALELTGKSTAPQGKNPCYLAEGSLTID